MIQSMTGYGKAICELPSKKISIEIKSLNSKQLDLNTRIPNLYREKDIEIRNTVASRLVRGKIDVSFYVEAATSDKITKINETVIKDYHGQLQKIASDLNIESSTDFLKIIMPLPDTVKVEAVALDETEWKAIMNTIKEAISDIESFRTQEGSALEKDIKSRISTIGSLLEETTQFEEERINKIKTRIRENLEEAGQKHKVDENRFEQELIYYLEKLDVTEEKVRLQNHLDYFIETMDSTEFAGKKLGFITQEIGREINTLGSKANNVNLQKIVIQMKDELEKIKEQNLNVL